MALLAAVDAGPTAHNNIVSGAAFDAEIPLGGYFGRKAGACAWDVLEGR